MSPERDGSSTARASCRVPMKTAMVPTAISRAIGPRCPTPRTPHSAQSACHATDDHDYGPVARHATPAPQPATVLRLTPDVLPSALAEKHRAPSYANHTATTLRGNPSNAYPTPYRRSSKSPLEANMPVPKHIPNFKPARITFSLFSVFGH